MSFSPEGQSGRSAVDAKGSALLPRRQVSDCWSSWYSFYSEWNDTEYLYPKRDLPTHLTPPLLWGSCLALFQVREQRKYIYVGITWSAQDSWYHSLLLVACSFSESWNELWMNDFWLSWGIFDHLQCFKQSCLLKTSEPTLPSNLETPKLGMSFTSRAAGTANKQKKRSLVGTAVKTISTCHLSYQCI